MLQRDYLLEVISQFVEVVTRALRAAHASDEVPASRESAREVEQSVAGLLDMDPDVAMGMEPASLVTMMVLSGLGEAVSGYVAFALSRVADVYDRIGEEDLAGFRREQAKAIAESFGCSTDNPPEELAPLAQELDGK